MIKKSFLWFYRVAFDLLGFFIVAFLSATIAIQYYFLPHFDDYKGRITEKISQTLGQKVTIGEIQAKWNGLNPHLSISNMDIYDKENRIALSLKQVEASLSWTSIPMLEPRLASLGIYQPELTIRREADGVVYVAGISMSGPNETEFPNWLLRQASVNVVDANIIWQDELRHAPELALNHLNLQLENPAWDSLRGRHQFSLKATPSTGASKPIDIRGNILGKDLSRLEKWHGTVYAKIEDTDLAAWRRWLDYPSLLQEGHGSAQLWVSFADSQVEAFTSDLSLENVFTQLPYKGPNAGEESRFKKIAGRIQWKKLSNGQEVSGENLSLVTSDNLKIKSGKFFIRDRLIKQKALTEGNIHLDEIQLETINNITSYFDLPNNIQQALNETEPAGKLSKLNLTWLSTDKTISEYSFTADFSGLGLKPYRALSTPGFSNVSGKLKLNQHQGKLSLQTKGANFSFPDVLRWPIPVDSLVGEIKWKIKEDNLDVDINRLFIKNSHLNAAIDGSYKQKGKGIQYIDLTARANDIDAQYGRFYYPLSISKATTDWLDTSIISGRGENLSLTLRGDLKDFPWNGKNGLFRLTAKVKDAVLDHATGWPKIEDIGLDMLFEGRRMELNVHDGHSYGNQIKTAKVTIPDLMIDDNILDVVGEAQGPVSEAVKFANNSPIEKIASGFTDYLKATGNGKLLLNLHIPLTKLDASKIKGSYTVVDASMQSESIPELSKINGTLNFTESSISANNVNAFCYGGPAQFSINTDKNHHIQISAKGRVTDTGLRKNFAGLVPKGITGSADWSAKAQIINKQTEVAIRSNLVGIHSELPFPLGKTANDSMLLAIDKKQTSATQDLVKISLGNAVNAKLARVSQNGSSKIDRGDIGVNAVAELGPTKGILLHGNLDNIDLDEWLDQLDKNAPSSNASANGMAISRVDLSTNRLDIFDHRINSARINAKAINRAWAINLKSNEINGDIKWNPDGNGKITANLSTLILPEPTPDNIKKTTSAPTQLNIKYPALDIVADNFEFNAKKMGHLELQAKEQFGNWGIEKLRLINPDGTLSANGEWNNWKRRPNTLVRFNWEVSDIGKALKRFNYGDLVKGGTGEISGQLKWAGSPHEFDFPNLSGNLHIDAKKGQILKAEPGVARLFGVISLQNLPRRLTLDFKDLFSSGFAFDKISADVDINKGIMHSDNFKMEGPSAKVEIKGDTDLDKETLHLHVKATPFISDTVSLAAFAGGPAVGAAAYVAQKILKDPLNKIAETEYEIVGTWSDPQERDSKPSAPNKPGIIPSPLNP